MEIKIALYKTLINRNVSEFRDGQLLLIIGALDEPSANWPLEVDAVERAIAQRDVPFVASPGNGSPPIAGDAPGAGEG